MTEVNVDTLVDEATQDERPPSFLSMLARLAPALSAGVGAGGVMPMFASHLMDQRQYDQRKDALRSEIDAAAGNTTATDQAIADVTGQNTQALGTGTADGSGYLGVADMLDVGAAAPITNPDGSVSYVVQVKDGARQVRYQEGDPYRELQDLGPAQLKEWRRTMWLGGYMEPDSFVGALNTEDVAAMKKAMTEANMTGVSWQDAIASRVELGGRYGRPITEEEIAKLDNNVPKLLRQYASKNGVSVSDDFIARQQERVLNGEDTPDSVLSRFRDTHIKPMYPQFERELDDGLTIQDIATPYIDRASQMLEISPKQIGIDDPLIKRVLQARDDKGQPVRKPIWEFEDELTRDPRWARTNNAYATYDGAVSGLLREMGL